MKSKSFSNGGAALCVIAVLAFVPTMMAQRTGTVVESKSKIDAERQVQVVPGWLKGDGLLSTTFLVGGFWTDKSPTNFVLEVVVRASGLPKHLRVSMDGRLIEFDAAGPSSVFETGTLGSAYHVVGIQSRFPVPLAFIEDMLHAKKVIMEVSTTEGTKQEGTLVGGSNMAKAGFRKALEKISGH